ARLRAPRRGGRRLPHGSQPRPGGWRPEETREATGIGGADIDSAQDGMAEVEVQQADITKLDVDAIANAANTDLKHGGGVAGAIVRAGGRVVQDESDALAPIGHGEAVATTAGRMPACWVIHAATMELGVATSAEAIRRA